ncbi:HesA/MoeB/ThiF family protein [Demequina gelatinilytica]|uniref:HesA/MoeB/ThiF family protein n=1 Tax=Demequina gelatinilytica TaxID=1638980 RepID=UPI000B056FAC|nr:HesA/MoeB/ThiF family protein [Demequina gelatinilytica]
MEADAYVRQRALPGFGAAGQDALAAARVAVVGAGGLGCPAALYLAAAGVGSLTLIDSDRVSVTNLHRQVLFGPGDVGRPKVAAASEALARVAPAVDVTGIDARLDAATAPSVLAGHDLVLDCTDTWPSRLAVADACAGLRVPLVWGAVQGWFGQVTVFAGGATLRDIFPTEPAPDFGLCDAGGVLGPLCGQVGAAMASQAIVALTGTGRGLSGTLQVVDARDGAWRSLPVGASSRGGAHA